MWQPLKVSGQHWKMQFLRIADKIVERLAQQQVADVLARSFKEIDLFIAEVELHIKQKQILQHACNEHTQARLTNCKCDYCRINNELRMLSAQRSMVNYSHSWETTPSGYIFSLDVRINKLRNLRRQLLGFPPRILVPIKNPKFKQPSYYPYFSER
jgi:hypothetical protein